MFCWMLTNLGCLEYFEGHLKIKYCFVSFFYCSDIRNLYLESFVKKKMSFHTLYLPAIKIRNFTCCHVYLLIETKKNLQIKTIHLTLTQHSLTKYGPQRRKQLIYLDPVLAFLSLRYMFFSRLAFFFFLTDCALLWSALSRFLSCDILPFDNNGSH